MSDDVNADTPPQELLEQAGQTGPPVRLAPLIALLGCEWRYHRLAFPRVEPAAPDTILVPAGRANDPKVRFGIAHDLRHAALRLPGGFDDLAVPHLREREQAFDLWARELLMPAGWFKPDALRCTPVARLAARYQVEPNEVVSRAIDLELCHLACRDRDSYGVYLRHPWWVGDKLAGHLGRRITYLTTHRYCEMIVNGRPCGSTATTVHHVSPGGYQRLGRERDDDLRALCPLHHGAQHPRIGAEQLTLDLGGAA
jgi:hypothetical protein